MVWFLFALLSAFSESLKDIFSKKRLAEVDEYSAAWGMRMFAALCLIPVVLFFGIPSLGSSFWFALLVAGFLNMAAQVLYFRALKSSDISVSVPVLSFTPVFLIVTSPLIVGESPAIVGVAGIFMIVIGAYVLQLSEANKGLLEPFKALIHKPGPRMMLGVAFIWSITSNMDKIGIQNSSPFFWAFSISLFIAVGLSFFVFTGKNSAMRHWKGLFPLGLFNAFSLAFQMLAVSIALVPYVIALKRTSIISSVISGHFVFRERNFAERLVGALIMVAGVVLILLSS